MKLFQVSILLVLASTSATCLKIEQMTVAGLSLVEVNDENFAVVNLEGEFSTVTLNGDQIMKTRADCTRVFETMGVILNSQRESLKTLIRGIDSQFVEPIEKTTTERKYKIVLDYAQGEADLREPKRSNVFNYGSEIEVQSLVQRTRVIEIIDDNIHVFESRIFDSEQIVRLIFLDHNVVEVFSNGKVQAQPIQCLTGRDMRFALMRSMILQDRDDRMNQRASAMSSTTTTETGQSSDQSASAGPDKSVE